MLAALSGAVICYVFAVLRCACCCCLLLFLLAVVLAFCCACLPTLLAVVEQKFRFRRRRCQALSGQVCLLGYYLAASVYARWRCEQGGIVKVTVVIGYSALANRTAVINTRRHK